MFKKLLLLVSHAAMLAFGFALGIYLLPTLTAPESPSQQVLQSMAAEAEYRAVFKRDLAGSDFLHWGDGQLSVTTDAVVFEGKLAPGPDYQLYLVPEFVETEAQFEAVKSQALAVGAVKTFDNFIVELPQGLDLARYNTVLVWCESFGEFISAAQYR